MIDKNKENIVCDRCNSKNTILKEGFSNYLMPILLLVINFIVSELVIFNIRISLASNSVLFIFIMLSIVTKVPFLKKYYIKEYYCKNCNNFIANDYNIKFPIKYFYGFFVIIIIFQVFLNSIFVYNILKL